VNQAAVTGETKTEDPAASGVTTGETVTLGGETQPAPEQPPAQ